MAKTVMALCAAAFCAATLAECPRWISVMPLKGECAEELAKDSADLGETTLVDGIAWCCTLHPEGDPVADRAAIYADAYRKVAPRLKSLSSVKQGILLQATMGHGGRPGSPTPWQLTVQRDGKRPRRPTRLADAVAAHRAEGRQERLQDVPDGPQVPRLHRAHMPYALGANA